MRPLWGVPVWAVLIVAMISTLATLHWWSYTIDDAYITARCAENLVETGTPSFNPGDSSEVASSPASVWLMAAAIFCGINSIVTAKTLGLLAAVATSVLVFRAVHNTTRSSLVATCAGLIIATAPGWTIHAVGGLETTIFGLAVLGVCLLPEQRAGFAGFLPWVASVAAASVLRPEGLLVAFLAIAWAWSPQRRRIGIIAIAVVVGLTVLRFAVHGALVPLAFDAKPSFLRNLLSQDVSVVDSLRYLETTLSMKARKAPFGMGWMLVASYLVVVAHCARREKVAITHLIGMLGLGLFVVSPPDWMPAQRFLVPYLPVIVVSVVPWIYGLLEEEDFGGAVARKLVAASFALVLVVMNLDAQASWSSRYRSHDVIAALDASQFHAPIGRWLRVHAERGDRLLAYEVGAVGYFGGLHVIDHEGIAHEQIAERIAGAGWDERIRSAADAVRAKEVVEIAVNENPDWLLVRSRIPFEANAGLPMPPPFARTRLQKMLLRRLGTDYRIAAVFTMTRPHDRYILLHDPQN